MKKLTSTVLAVLTALLLIAQSPQAFKYQAVVRNDAGEILAGHDVSFRISILQRGTADPAVYVETHDTATNKQGLVSLEIGNGSVVSGIFTTINWGKDDYFIQVEIDDTCGFFHSLNPGLKDQIVEWKNR
jgi:hypothetical protein